MMTIVNSKKAFHFDMMIIIIMLTTFINIPELLALNFTEEEWESQRHRDLFVWPFVLDECQGSCGFFRRCRSGLECARDNQYSLAASGLDRQFAYCRIPNTRRRRYFCYDPTKFKHCFTDSLELYIALASYYNASDTIQKYGYISEWCVGLITDFSFMFYQQYSFNEDISKWNTSSATNMFGMFASASSFNQDISQWDVSKVLYMIAMFDGATTFNQDISQWDVSNVAGMSFMFFNATSFNQDISKWDVSKVIDMNGMFGYTTSFNQDISKWNVSTVTDMGGMFYNVDSFNQDISHWNVSNVMYMEYMFQNAVSFNQNLSGWDISKVISIDSMFSGATSFNQNLCSWNANCQSLLYSNGTFDGASSCPNQTDPVCGSGPFCYNCK